MDAPITAPEPAVESNPSTRKQALPPGPIPDLLSKRYRIERLLGVGGMGAVYRATDLLREQFGDPQPRIAIKALNDTFAEYPDAHALLYSEFALTSRLHHAHVVQLYGFHTDSSCRRAYITMELLKGPTLDDLISANPQGMPWDQLQEIAVALLQALAYSHSRGVLHGDIKPSNVIMAEDGLRLFDFGLGQSIGDHLPGLPRLSRTRLAAWTPRYAALELLEGEALTEAADVYAAACVLYELSSGHHPFSRLTASQAREMAQDRTLQRPSSLPAHCWAVLRQALAFDQQHRPDSQTLLQAFSAQPPSFLRRLFVRRQG